MSSVNKVIIIGRMGRDAETRTVGGNTVANFTVATDESWTDKSGQRQEKTEWHRVSVWGQAADFAAKYLGKGRLVYVEGSLETREWVDKEGVKRQTTEIKAFVLRGLDKPPERAQQSAATSAPPAANNGGW